MLQRMNNGGKDTFTAIEKRGTFDNKYAYAREMEEVKRKQMQETALATADVLDVYGGKRFLGLTPKGKRVFISYKLNRQDMSVEVSTTHDLDILLKEGAKLAQVRTSVNINAQIKDTDTWLLRPNKDAGMHVTERKIRYLQRLKEISDIKYHVAFNKVQPTRYFIRMLAHAIHVGLSNNGEPNFEHIIKAWGFLPSRHDDYFVPETVWDRVA
jgi:hypothetical protein